MLDWLRRLCGRSPLPTTSESPPDARPAAPDSHGGGDGIEALRAAYRSGTAAERLDAVRDLSAVTDSAVADMLVSGCPRDASTALGTAVVVALHGRGDRRAATFLAKVPKRIPSDGTDRGGRSWRVDIAPAISRTTLRYPVRSLMQWSVAAVMTAAVGTLGLAQGPPIEAATRLEAQGKAAEQDGRVREAFDLYVRAAQALPDPPPLDVDVRLRGKIIIIGSRLDPRPVSSEEAERLAVRGQVLFKDAKDETGFKKAEMELRKAVRAAPWLTDLAYNLALVQEKLEYYGSAAANMKLYLLTNPPDAAGLRAKMYEFELRHDENKEAAEKEACAYGDATACRAVESRRMGVGSSFAVFHYHRPITSLGKNQFLAGQLAIKSDRIDFVESSPGNSDHGFSAPCGDIDSISEGTGLVGISGDRSRKRPVVWMRIAHRGNYSFWLTEDTTSLAEEQAKQQAIIGAIKYVCPKLK